MNKPLTTRDKVIEAMYHLVAEVGYDKSSINKIAQIVGIQKPSVYYYFESKESIFLEVLAGLYPLAKLIEDQKIVNSTDKGDFHQQLINLGYSIIETYRNDTERRLVLAELDIQAQRIPSVWEQKAHLDQENIEAWQTILQHGKDIGAFPSSFDVEVNAQMFFVMSAGISYSVANKGAIDSKTIWKNIVNSLFVGE
ncbi:TetR/AcrR family transcriptional regulator [Lactobacillus sp. YT155]|uniref:TetR/AcrR family transcriptional regulator n=1 Tax=Lactobacillus sp. YT155 TaxID=3060955 RepID=UPI00265F09D5|nr:TetR/AcrR family transcriptional regulator [Lactobacillus sp. YT155]MDO1604709.1 TetR/AcrR family transcriptional regulator [Lactobacillus sp. YT155]